MSDKITDVSLKHSRTLCDISPMSGCTMIGRRTKRYCTTHTNTNMLISFQGNRPTHNCIEPIIRKATQWMDHQLTSSAPLPPLCTARYSSDKGTAALIHDFTSRMTAWLFSLHHTGRDK